MNGAALAMTPGSPLAAAAETIDKKEKVLFADWVKIDSGVFHACLIFLFISEIYTNVQEFFGGN